MSEKQKQLRDDILAANEKLPIEKQYQLLGVAQGMGMDLASASVETESAMRAYPRGDKYAKDET